MASPREEGELLESSSSSSDEEDSEEEKSGKSGPSAVKFKNDGSFLEMFKKMQESSQTQVPENTLHKQELVKDADTSSSPEKCSMKKEEEPAASATPSQPAQQKKPGLMSIVSLSPPDSPENQLSCSLKQTISSSDPKDDILARHTRRFQIQSYS